MLASPCGKQAICENAVPGYNCRCPQGYAGQPTPDVACEQVMMMGGCHFFFNNSQSPRLFSHSKKKRGKRLFSVYYSVETLVCQAVKKRYLGRLYPSKALPLGRALYIHNSEWLLLPGRGRINRTLGEWGYTRCASLMTWHFPFSNLSVCDCDCETHHHRSPSLNRFLHSLFFL